MEFRVLGPVELAAEGRTVPIRSPLQRSLLAMLLVDANRTVAVDRIVDALWGDAGWDSGHRRLWFHVSKLRSRLDGGHASIERSGSGYRLHVDTDRIDANRFARLIGEVREQVDGDPAAAATTVREALTLWRGAPYADVDEDAIGRAERVRLEQLHLGAVELWIESELRQRHTGLVIPELDKLIVDHPYREGFRAQLMRTLAAEQRPSEALAVFAATRRLLRDDLDTPPSAALHDLAKTIAAATADHRRVAPPTGTPPPPSTR